MHGHIQNKDYIKFVDPAKHKLKKPPRFWEHHEEAWAMDAADWDKVNHSISTVTYVDEASGIYWRISSKDFDAKKIPFNYGSHPQYCVLESNWQQGIWESKEAY